MMACGRTVAVVDDDRAFGGVEDDGRVDDRVARADGRFVIALDGDDASGSSWESPDRSMARSMSMAWSHGDHIPRWCISTRSGEAAVSRSAGSEEKSRRKAMASSIDRCADERAGLALVLVDEGLADFETAEVRRGRTARPLMTKTESSSEASRADGPEVFGVDR